MATNFSPILGAYTLNQLSSFVMFGIEEVLRISQWSNIAPSWPASFVYTESKNPNIPRAILHSLPRNTSGVAFQ